MKSSILRTAAVALVAGLAFSPAAFAWEGKVDEATQATIRATLTEQGYEVRKIDVEDGMIEVYALKEGGLYEIYLNDQLEVVTIKKED